MISGLYNHVMNVIPMIDDVVNAIFPCIECGDLKDRILIINSGVARNSLSIWGLLSVSLLRGVILTMYHAKCECWCTEKLFIHNYTYEYNV